MEEMEDPLPRSTPGTPNSWTKNKFRIRWLQPTLVCRAKIPVILEDLRVFQNMLDIEEFYTSYQLLQNIQVWRFHRTWEKLSPSGWRRFVWTSAVDVFPCPVTIMDRFEPINIKRANSVGSRGDNIYRIQIGDPCPISGSVWSNTDKYLSIDWSFGNGTADIVTNSSGTSAPLTPYDTEHLLKLLIGWWRPRPVWPHAVGSSWTPQDKLSFFVPQNLGFNVYLQYVFSAANMLAGCPKKVWRRGMIMNLTFNDLVSRLQILTRVENTTVWTIATQIEETIRDVRKMWTTIQQMGQNLLQIPFQTTPIFFESH